MKKENNITCTQAQPCYFDYLTGQYNPASDREFEHIKCCLQCQNEIKRLKQEIDGKSDSSCSRQDILAMHHHYLSAWIDCDVVKPFLASQVHPQLSITTQTPVTVHINQCESCQNDLQNLLSMELSGLQLVEAAQILSGQPCNPEHIDEQAASVIGSIRSRKASGIVTRLQTDGQGKGRVQVRQAYPALWKRRYFLVRFTAAAGVLLVASLVIMMTTVAGGVSIQDVYSAIHKVENCRVEIRDAEAEIPGQVLLISRELNLVVSQRKNETVILDFQNKRILKSTPETGVVTDPSDSKLASAINRPDFGLLPFDSITQIPSNCQWQRKDTLSQGGEYEIYELSWVESTMVVGPIGMTWRGYLIKGSHLPVRIEWLEKRADKPQEVITETLIQYPDTQTILKELRANPVYHLLEGDQIK